MSDLYHWTCAHAAPSIRADGHVAPNLGISWWTDLAEPRRTTRLACGLTKVLVCDRMQYRCTATNPDELMPWRVWRVTAPRSWVEDLESFTWVKPEHWWVSPNRVPVRSVRHASQIAVPNGRAARRTGGRA